MRTLLNLLLVVYSMVVGAAEPEDHACNKECTTPFGALNGQSFLTKAYSNCNGDCVKNEDNFVVVSSDKKPVFSGMKWQCVEYARRWLIDNKGITFGDVTYAYHIWDLPMGYQVASNKPVQLIRFKNNVSKTLPEVGDLLIYDTRLAVTGHVAVVVGIEPDSITIAEQNYFNRTWEAAKYARRLLILKDKRGHYRIVDEALKGWVRFTNSI